MRHTAPSPRLLFLPYTGRSSPSTQSEYTTGWNSGKPINTVPPSSHPESGFSDAESPSVSGMEASCEDSGSPGPPPPVTPHPGNSSHPQTADARRAPHPQSAPLHAGAPSLQSPGYPTRSPHRSGKSQTPPGSPDAPKVLVPPALARSLPESETPAPPPDINIPVPVGLKSPRDTPICGNFEP